MLARKTPRRYDGEEFGVAGDVTELVNELQNDESFVPQLQVLDETPHDERESGE